MRTLQQRCDNPTFSTRRKLHRLLLLLTVFVSCFAHRSIVLAREDSSQDHPHHPHPPQNVTEQQQESLHRQDVPRRDDEVDEQPAHGDAVTRGQDEEESLVREKEAESNLPPPPRQKDQSFLVGHDGMPQQRQQQHFSGLSRDEYGIWTLRSSESFSQILKKEEYDRPHGLLLTLMYTESDKSCASANHDPWVSKIEDAANFVKDSVFFPGDSDIIQFGKLDTSNTSGASEWLAGIGIESTPAFVFIVARNFHKYEKRGTNAAFILDYIGPLETSEDVGITVLQYYTRLFLTSTTPTTFRPFPDLPEDFSSQVVPRQFPDIQQVQGFWSSTTPSHLVWKIANSVVDKPGGVSQHWSDDDKKFIQWLTMNGRQQLSVTLFIQCQAHDDNSIVRRRRDNYFVTFAEMAWILSSRRDVWFVGITKHCPLDMTPGQVAAYRFFQGVEYHKGWESPLGVSSSLSTRRESAEEEAIKKEELRRFLVRHSTPSVLWFDRYSTAPIAFADDYKVHLLLLVNIHPLKNEVEMYSADLQRVVQEFHDHCDEIREDPNNNDSICLIVPSTETRILTTFGIDFWSPLDDHANRDDNNAPPPAFPTLLITDRRPQQKQYRDGTITTTHAVMRYLLRPTKIFAEGAVQRFCNEFWNDLLLPELRSVPWRDTDVKVNKFGVTTLNAAEFQQRFQTMATTQEHALVLFTQPSCGHCKRFHNIYNEASKILRDVQWDEHMALYKVEVSQNNEVQGIPLPWLPDVYYFPPNSSSTPTTTTTTEEEDMSQSLLPIAPVRYDVTDQFGNGVGRLSDPLDLIEWWLDVMIGAGKRMDPDVLLQILDNEEKAK